MTTNNGKATNQPPNPIAFVLDAKQPVLTGGRSMQAETGVQAHTHPRGQLLWAASGVIKVTSLGSVWVVPSSHAVWIPGKVLHQVYTQTPTQLKNLYVDPSYTPRKPHSGVAMLKMTSLMREIILRLTTQADQPPVASTQRLGMVAIDEIATLTQFECYLPAGEDPRLVKLINHIVGNPEQQLSLKALATMVGASTRTIERLFKSQTGMTYRQWRSRYRLIGALEYIRQGYGTNQIAYELGYSSISAFISAFKELLGYTPQEYARQHNFVGAIKNSP